MTEFLGHFHPLIVHLPIGILLIGLLLYFLSAKEKYASVKPALPVILLAGAVSAFISCITGYFLSISDDYDESLVSWHMWMGIAVAFVSLVLYAREKNPQFAVNKKLLSVGLFVLIMLTGHLGGSLTHGSDYLTKPLKTIFSNDSDAAAIIKPIPNVQEAYVYADIVQPMLEAKCYSCHGANKQKGGLRMDDSLKLMKGGKDGEVIEPGSAEQSELIKRILLPVDNDDHMPPREKSQLNESQVALLHWWIDQGAGFGRKVNALEQPEKIKPLLLALQKATEQKKQDNLIPSKPVEKAGDNIISQLKQKGIIVLPVAQNSNYLFANFVTDTIVDNTDLQLLLQIKKQLIWLKLSGTDAGDAHMQSIAQLTGLTKLTLASTNISDKGLQQLQTLQQLRYLNLVATKVSTAGIMQLKPLQNLETIYLYKTNTAAKDYPQLKTVFPNAVIDTGGYVVPIFVTDTTEVKDKRKT